jgi:hypothetical protein
VKFHLPVQLTIKGTQSNLVCCGLKEFFLLSSFFSKNFFVVVAFVVLLQMFLLPFCDILDTINANPGKN